MKLATLACLATLCLIGPRAHAAPGEPGKATPAPSTAPSASPAQAPAPVSEPAPVQGQAAPRSENSGRAERRRRSYAACNRAAHQRSLRGGKRRRFMIRCRLGYERTRQQPVQAPASAPATAPSAAPAAAPPGRKP